MPLNIPLHQINPSSMQEIILYNLKGSFMFYIGKVHGILVSLMDIND